MLARRRRCPVLRQGPPRRQGQAPNGAKMSSSPDSMFCLFPKSRGMDLWIEWYCLVRVNRAAPPVHTYPANAIPTGPALEGSDGTPDQTQPHVFFGLGLLDLYPVRMRRLCSMF